MASSVQDGDIGAPGEAMGMLDDPQAAIAAAKQALRVEPSNRPALQLLSGAMRRLGYHEAAERAEVEALRLSLEEPAIRVATAALAAGRVGEAERHVRQHIVSHPNDSAALRILGDIAARADRPNEAERLLRRALALTPAFATARKELAILLHKESRPDDAIAVLDARLKDFPATTDLLHLKAILLARSGATDAAIAISEAAIAGRETSAVLWLSHARLLASTGRRAEAVAAYRAACRIDRTLGAAWWGIADTDVTTLDDGDVATMQAALGTDGVEPQQLVPIAFALGRVFEQRGDGGAAFRHFERGHAVRRRAAPYDADALTRFVEDQTARCTNIFFAQRAGHGLSQEGPIFVVGMHRAGSTLVEQILASHPSVEGLAELPQLGKIARKLGLGDVNDAERYGEALNALTSEQAALLGETYLAQIARVRRSDRPCFVDKMPGNWRLIPLIRLILPAAIIIDARRDPFDCCVSNFCRYFAGGQNQADDLVDLGRYYRDYARFANAMAATLPERVRRVDYEALVDRPEAAIATLLEACRLPFDERCLRFFETERAIRTPSAQQVRRPVNRDGIGRWRLFAPWLEPLARGLGTRVPVV